ncbi:sugar ABC transporter permease [Kribbella jejuensis]|uniref:Multiple sugar transport system permease protein n=1 Tax=Kribbella jejuensis TaxID=236068 RepID=A0A542ELS2_9ACTN|nr:sugar ABC transporter permease [Kribbella jejuensis]TQJ16289.1 multiple sugar transport system permease protein [Kribbella jejuensis]
MTATLTAPPQLNRKKQGKPKQNREAILLFLPALLPVLILSVYPLIRGIALGFTNARAGLHVESKFVGFDNFAKLLHNNLFWDSFRIGVIWTLSVTILQFVAALGLALLLNTDLKFRGVARTLALIPWAMPPVVVAIMWRLLLHPTNGPVNEILQKLHLTDHPINFLGDFSTALPAVIVVGIWVGMPMTTVTLLAGLQGIDRTLYEAAAVDGAGAWSQFWYITLPQLRTVIVAITSLDMIWNFNSFGLVYVLTAGGPGGKTMLPMLFAYNEAFRYGNFGMAAAMGDVMVVIIILFLFFYLRNRLRSEA